MIKEKLIYEKSINKNICFESKDYIDDIIIKIGSLHTISVQNFASTKCYINSIETNDYRKTSERNETFEELRESWSIESKEMLIETIHSLLAHNKNEEIDYIRAEFLEILSENKISIPKLKDREFTTESYDIQRAIVLLRDGVSCGLINIDKYNEIKIDIFKKIEEHFEYLDLNGYIFEYLLGYHNFCKSAGENIEEKEVLNLMFNSRVEGIKLLFENNYFDNFRIKKIEKCNNTVLLEDLQTIAGIYYEKNKRSPFEGIVGSYSLNGEMLKEKHFIKNGRFDGVSVYYFLEREIRKLVKYENGKILLGEFVYKKERNCFEASSNYLGTEVFFSIDNEKELNKEKAVEVCCTIYKKLSDWIKKAADYTFENLVEIANDDWLDEDDQIEKQDIIKSLKKKIIFYIEYDETVHMQFIIRDLCFTIIFDIEGNVTRGEFS